MRGCVALLFLMVAVAGCLGASGRPFDAAADADAGASGCRLVTGLSFCSHVNYTSSVSDPQQLDGQVAQVYAKYAPMRRQTGDCLNSYKAYLCASNFPMCPYCPAANGICVDSCFEMRATCGEMAGDTISSCYAGSVFVHNVTAEPPVCTPAYGGARPVCDVVDEYDASFCYPEIYGTGVVSAPNQPRDVWITMDNVSLAQWRSFVRPPNVSDDCKLLLRSAICLLNFSPCVAGAPADPFDPSVGLDMVCNSIIMTCPTGYSKVCSRSAYKPPDPAQCP